MCLCCGRVLRNRLRFSSEMFSVNKCRCSLTQNRLKNWLFFAWFVTVLLVGNECDIFSGSSYVFLQISFRERSYALELGNLGKNEVHLFRSRRLWCFPATATVRYLSIWVARANYALTDRLAVGLTKLPDAVLRRECGFPQFTPLTICNIQLVRLFIWPIEQRWYLNSWFGRSGAPRVLWGYETNQTSRYRALEHPYGSMRTLWFTRGLQPGPVSCSLCLQCAECAPAVINTWYIDTKQGVIYNAHGRF